GGLDLGKAADMIDSMEVRVTFPGKVISQEGNGTIDGHSVTWTNADDIVKGKASATAKDGSSSLLWLWLLLGALLIAAIAAALFFVLNNSKKKKVMAQQQAYLQQMPQYSMPGQQPDYGQQLQQPGHVEQPQVPQQPQQ
ncbi:MAG: LppM family (lipo)protein, partial [Propionibacteriaceae bacterium]